MTQNPTPPQPIRLLANENPMGPSPLAMAKMSEMMSQVNSYSGFTLFPLLQQGIAAAWNNRITPDHILLTHGGVGVLDAVARSYLTAPDDACLVVPPVFPFFINYCQTHGYPLIEVPLQGEAFHCDLTAVLHAITPQTRIVYLCNPNNPTGSYITTAELDSFMQQLPEHVLVVHDQAYHHFVDAPDFPDTIHHVLTHPNFLVLHTFSKVFGLAGMRIGYALAHPDIITRLAVYAHPFLLNKLAVVGATAALDDADHVRRSIDNNAHGKQWLTEQLEALDCHVWPTQASLLIFQYGSVPAQTIVDGLAARGVLVRVAFFLDDQIRLSIGNPAENQRFIEALTDLLAQLNR